ncbi:hypothetical protein AFK68_24430 [Hydrocoleum sp. CS-953]|nr:hypothetical protein AFK68_24430 [Hydrocoleum sp. CS-953]
MTNSKVSSRKDSVWSREVVVVTTSDRIEIPPIKYFWQLVKELIPGGVRKVKSQKSKLKS